MRYEDILKDEKLIKYLKAIDANHSSPISHGLNHALGVVRNVELLAALVNIDDESLNYLKIAALLHDSGMIKGKDEHCQIGAEFANEYLKNKISDEWREKIVNAILHHHEKKDVNSLSLVEHILLFADKSDVTKERVDLKYCEKKKDEMPFISIIEDISYQIKDDTFILTYKVKEERNLSNWDYFPKLDMRTKEFAAKLGLNNYKIRLVK